MRQHHSIGAWCPGLLEQLHLLWMRVCLRLCRLAQLFPDRRLRSRRSRHGSKLLLLLLLMLVLVGVCRLL